MATYKRSIYLINPNFQLKLSGFICLLVFVSSIIYPFTIYDMLSNFISQIAGSNPEMSASLAESRKSLIIMLSIWQLGFTLLVFILCIFLSHKIAGPMYKLQKFLHDVQDNGFNGRLFFRKGDYFQEVAEDINDTFEELEEKYQNDMVYLGEVSSYLNNLSMVVPDDKKVVLNEITQRLGEIQERYQHSDNH